MRAQLKGIKMSIGICKVYPELGPIEDIDRCYSFQVLDIRSSNICCSNCCSWVAVDSITTNDVVMMLFPAEGPGACDRLPDAECYGCNGCEREFNPPKFIQHSCGAD